MQIEVSKDVEKIITNLSLSSDVERGEVYTKSEVVDFMLDLLGYKSTKDLTCYTILEPSFGKGDFLKAIVERLLKSFFKFHSKQNPVSVLSNCVRAIELSKNSFEQGQIDLISLMSKYGISTKNSKKLLKSWLFNSDFLLVDFDVENFDFVIGNPPYIRQEQLSDKLLEQYKLRYKTIYDRADIYVPFIEKALDLLSKTGQLSFICSDRWVKNKYGGPLRGKISKDYNLDVFIDMKKADAFLREVTAYPSIFVISRNTEGETVTKIPTEPIANVKLLKQLSSDLKKDHSIEKFSDTALGNEPWLLDCPKSLKVLRKIESKFQLIEDEGCKVGIGVASGNDKVYIVPSAIDIERDRKLPILLSKDIKSGEINYKGKVLLDPFDKKGALISLEDYPKLKKYFDKNSDLIKKRYVAKKNPKSWFRTIDKVHAGLTKENKLLIPDIKGKANIVLDYGKFYPHHNLYYILSNSWELEALQAILKSSVSLFFVGMYSVQMRGGYLRYQAQYLRRIRIPSRKSVEDKIVKSLIKYNEANDLNSVDRLVYDIFNLNPKDIKTISKQNERVG